MPGNSAAFALAALPLPLALAFFFLPGHGFKYLPGVVVVMRLLCLVLRPRVFSRTRTVVALVPG